MFTVLITSIFLRGDIIYALCLVCKLSANMVVDTCHEAELRCLVSDLSRAFCKPNGKVSKLIASILTEQKQCILSCSLTHISNTKYQQVLRQVRLVRQISSDIQSMLGGKSFKRNFEYVINTFDMSIFGLCPNNKCEVTFLLEDGFTFLDNLFFARWDVSCNSSDPTSKFNFVRSVRVKATLHSLNVAVVKAQSTATLSNNYREEAVKSLLAVQSETLLPVTTAPTCTQADL